MSDENELGGRHRHHWSGRDRAKDFEALADKVAAVVELYNDNGRLVRLGPAGELVPINFAAFRDLIASSIAGVRVVDRGGVWRCESTGTPSRPSHGLIQRGRTHALPPTATTNRMRPFSTNYFGSCRPGFRVWSGKADRPTGALATAASR
jgi:hypothetical protein